jgi:hypothetical protein
MKMREGWDDIQGDGGGGCAEGWGGSTPKREGWGGVD